MQIEVPDEQLGCVAEYAEITGRPVEECFTEAVDDWIRVVAATAFETERPNVIMFPDGPYVMLRPGVA